MARKKSKIKLTACVITWFVLSFWVYRTLVIDYERCQARLPSYASVVIGVRLFLALERIRKPLGRDIQAAKIAHMKRTLCP